jgi:cellulose synthase (UDP-forming)
MTTETIKPDAGPDKAAPERSKGRVFLERVSVIVPCIVVLYLSVLPLDWMQQLFLSLALILFAVLMNKLTSSHMVTLTLTGMSIFSSTRYIYYRFANTFGVGPESGAQPQTLDMVFMVILLSAELYAFGVLLLGYFQTIRPLERKPAPMPENPETWPTLDIFIPSYNEPLSIVRYTVWAAMNLDYPRELFHVHILDDGRREEFRQFAESVGCGYITRTDNKHAKAGNINAALTRTHGEYVAIFDCDHVPTRSFLQMTLGWFIKDERLAMLQTPHHFYSPDPFERNLKQFHKIPNEGELFYGLVQDGNDLWNATFFCGSCAVLRRTALEEIDGIAVETVTEDAHTSLRMQMRGWNTAYINIPQAAGLATESLSSHVGQRVRWARGMIQILRTDFPLTCPGLKLTQRICYFNAMVHFLYAIPRLIFLTSPLVYLLLGQLNIRGYSLTIMAYALPHVVLSNLVNSRIQGKYRYSFWNEVYEAVLTPYILFPTLLALINPRLGTFNVTAKGGLVAESRFDRKIAAPYTVLLLLNLLGLAFGIPRILWWDSAHPGTVIMNMVWTLYNVIILGVTCAVAMENKQLRGRVRVTLKIPIILSLPDSKQFDTETVDLSSTGLALRVPRGLKIVPGDKLSVQFALRFTQHEIPATVVDNKAGVLRLQFLPLTLAQEEELTRVLYSRADSWLSTAAERERDRPLKSLGLLAKLSVRGVAAALSNFGRSKQPEETADVEKPETPPEKPPETPSKVNSMAGTAVILLGAICLLSNPAHAARPRQSSSAEAVKTSKSSGPRRSVASSAAAQSAGTQAPLEDTFHTSNDLASLGSPQPIILHGTQSRFSVKFELPNSEVVTSATFVMRYRLAPQLSDQASLLNLVINGIGAASVPLLHSSAESVDEQASISIPAELLLTENTLEFQLAGVCGGANCGSPSVITVIQPTSKLDLVGRRLALASDLSLLPAPFLDPASDAPAVPFAFLVSPDPKTLRAAGIVASWFGMLSDYHGIHFPVTINHIPQENAVIVGPASSLPETLGLSQVQAPTIAIRPNPSDPFGKVLVITGTDEEQVLQAATALTLSEIKENGDTAKISSPYVEPPARAANDAPRWLTQDREATLAESFGSDLLVSSGLSSRTLFFRLAPDLYFGNRGGIPLRLTFRAEGLQPQQRAELNVYLNSTPVGHILISADGAPIQHATVLLPVTALLPYSNSVLLTWKADGWIDSNKPPVVHLMRNSSIDFQGVQHFAEMPKLERFAEAGYPFTRYADLSRTAVVMGSNDSPGTLGAFLDLAGFFGAQTGYPALRISVASSSEIGSLTDKDVILLGRYSDSEMLNHLAEALPVRISPNVVRLTDADSWWLQLRRSAWNPKGRTRQSIEDLLEADPGPQGLITGFQSPQGGSLSVVGIFGKDDEALDQLGAQLSGIKRNGSIYGSISVFYNGTFESLYLRRDDYQIGTLPQSQAINIWIVRRIYLLPFLIVLCCFLPTLWVLPQIERRIRLRLEAKA